MGTTVVSFWRVTMKLTYELVWLHSRIFVFALAPALLVSHAARADDVSISVSVAPKNIRSNNVTEKSDLFKSLGQPAFRDALTVLKRPKDQGPPEPPLFPDGSSVVYGYGYQTSGNAIIPYGAEFEFERRTGTRVALVGEFGCNGDLNCIDPSFPAMRIGVCNIGSVPLSVRQVVVKVQKSERDLAPRFGVSYSPGFNDLLTELGGISLANESSSAVKSARLDFDLSCSTPDIQTSAAAAPSHVYQFSQEAKIASPPADSPPDIVDPFKGKEVGRIYPATRSDGERMEFDFWQELAKIVPDIAHLLQQYYDQFPNLSNADLQPRVGALYVGSRCKPYLVGRLTGTYAGPGGSATPFASAVLTKVNVGFSGGGADSAFSVNLGRANLNATGSNYQVVVAANRTIPSGQEVSFAVDLTADESSIHDLAFQIVADRGTFQSEAYQARIFVPWSSVLWGRMPH